MKSVIIKDSKGKMLIHIKKLKDGTFDILKHCSCESVDIKILTDNGTYVAFLKKPEIKKGEI